MIKLNFHIKHTIKNRKGGVLDFPLQCMEYIWNCALPSELFPILCETFSIQPNFTASVLCKIQVYNQDVILQTAETVLLTYMQQQGAGQVINFTSCKNTNGTSEAPEGQTIKTGWLLKVIVCLWRY